MRLAIPGFELRHVLRRDIRDLNLATKGLGIEDEVEVLNSLLHREVLGRLEVGNDLCFVLSRFRRIHWISFIVIL